MTTRLHLLCAASTSATSAVAFPGDEPLDAKGRNALSRFSGRLPTCRDWARSPARAAAQTAESLGVNAKIEPLLRDCDFGRWSGRSFEEVQAQEPEAIAEWLANPDASPHGGESFADVAIRVGGWMDSLTTKSGSVLAITHPTIIRAAIACALGSDPRSFLRIDISPLSRAKLSNAGGRWTLAALVPLKEVE